MDIEQNAESELLGLEYLSPKDIEKYFAEATQVLREAVMMFVFYLLYYFRYLFYV